MKPVTQQTAAASPTADTPPRPGLILPTDCPDCHGMGYPDDIPEHPCASCRGTGKYSGIPNAYGEPGVTAISVANDGQDTSADPRKLVRLETFACEIPLTLEGAEQLASRLYNAVYGVRHDDKERAFRAALANSERPLESVRDQLGPRAFNCLAREGVLTIERAAAMTDAELLCIVNLGFGTLQRIRAVVGRSSRPRQTEGDR